ncbi:hypothetical protein V6Z11_D10G035500 [Gossypium hirsutum]
MKKGRENLPFSSESPSWCPSLSRSEIGASTEADWPRTATVAAELKP